MPTQLLVRSMNCSSRLCARPLRDGASVKLRRRDENQPAVGFDNTDPEQLPVGSLLRTLRNPNAPKPPLEVEQKTYAPAEFIRVVEIPVRIALGTVFEIRGQEADLRTEGQVP